MIVEEIIKASIAVKQKILDDPNLTGEIERLANICSEALCTGNKILLCGNGGSAADAQHIAAELSGRFYKDRQPLDAEALHVNSSYLTAVANDYDYSEIYARMVNAKGRAGDVLIAISTSGNSANVVKAAEAANELSMITIGWTGATGGALKNICDIMIPVPSEDTARIQEAHITIGHIVCQIIEDSLFE